MGATLSPFLATAAPGKVRPPADLPPLFPPAFREFVEDGIANGALRGVAIGVIDGKRNETLYFGHRDGSASAPPDADSRFEIGAVTEVFTGILLAQAALDGVARLRDPAAKFLAPGFPFADPALAQATLEQLATQTAGLPLRPANLFPSNLGDPYADYATEDLFAFLARQSGDSTAVNSGYSVLSVGLLGNLLGRAYGAPFADVLNARVLAPLGVSHSGFDDAGVLPGHVRGDIAPHWHYGVLGAAAGLRATLPDLVRFLQYNLTPGESPLRAALLLARQARVSAGADQLGLGWKVREVTSADSTWPLVWRASETAGFSSFIGFRTDKQRAIVLLGNAAEDLADLGMAWLRGDIPATAPHGYAGAKHVDVSIYPGLYKLSNGTEIVVRANDGALSVQWPGSWPQVLRAIDKDVFAADNVALALTFMRNLDDITGLVLRSNDDNVSAQRLSEHAPRVARVPIAVSRERLSEFIGDYRLSADNWLRVAASKDGLTVQPSMGPHLALFCYAIDRFTDADDAVDLSAHRDESGRIDKLVLNLAGVKHDAAPLYPSTTH